MKANVIDRQVVDYTMKQAMEALKQVASEVGLEVSRGTARFSSEDFRVQITFQLPLKERNDVNDAEMIHIGYAKRGTKALFSDGREVVIVEARRTKYVFYFSGNPEKQFVARFGSFRPVKSDKEVK